MTEALSENRSKTEKNEIRYDKEALILLAIITVLIKQKADIKVLAALVYILFF